MNFEEFSERLMDATKERLSERGQEVVGYERNQELLSKVPHERMEDLAVVYRFELNGNSSERATILVSNDLMKKMGITHEQLREDALKNSPVMRPAVIKGMNEVMKEISFGIISCAVSSVVLSVFLVVVSFVSVFVQAHKPRSMKDKIRYVNNFFFICILSPYNLIKKIVKYIKNKVNW